MLRMDALVLIVVARRLAGPNPERRARLGDALLGGLVAAHERPGRIVRAGVDLEHVLHRGDKARVGLGWNDPVFVQMRLQIVFFSARPTVLKCAAGTILRSTTYSASRRIVQRAYPSGGGEQASAINWACVSPSKIGSTGGVARFLRVSTASSPFSTSLAYASHHADVGVERLANPLVRPAFASLGLIGRQPDARLQDGLRRRFSLADQIVEARAFSLPSLTMNVLLATAISSCRFDPTRQQSVFAAKINTWIWLVQGSSGDRPASGAAGMGWERCATHALAALRPHQHLTLPRPTVCVAHSRPTRPEPP
jgi:hypothetical protein